MQPKPSRKISARLARKLVSQLYTEDIASIERMSLGETSRVYLVKTSTRESDVVVRISENHTKINDYFKEQWCIQKAKEAGIPVPEILEVGNHIVPYPYSVVKFKKGIEGFRYEGGKKELYRQTGELAARINSIKTEGYGSVFDWSHNQLSKYETWKDYLEGEYKVSEEVDFCQKNEIFHPEAVKRFKMITDEIKKWKFEPVLVHNDFISKNVLVNKKGKITTVLDWERAISSHYFREIGKSVRYIEWESGPEYVKDFLRGYGMKVKEYKENKPYMFVFDLYFELIEIMEKFPKIQKKRMEEFKEYWERILRK